MSKIILPKKAEMYPDAGNYIFCNSCGQSPLLPRAAQAEMEFARAQSAFDRPAMQMCWNVMDKFHKAAAKMLMVDSADITFVSSTAAGVNLVAAGYPFTANDEILVYEHEFPSNYYPWLLQQNRGVKLKLIPNRGPNGEKSYPSPYRWLMEDLEALVTQKTRIVAISHVQFVSGYAADLAELGGFCRSKGIDLVVDAAQSLGALPLYPQLLNISAVVSSGWKWLLGPFGASVMYTSPEFREKLLVTAAGPGNMRQGGDYLNLNYDPVETGQRFEFSALPFSVAAALATSMEEYFSADKLPIIQDELFGSQDMLLNSLDRDSYSPICFPSPHRSGILAVKPKKDPRMIVQTLKENHIICSTWAGLLRIAPHFYTSQSEIERVVDVLNQS